MKKRWVAIFLVIVLIVPWAKPCNAEMKPRPEESKELMFQDMMMLFLLPHIDKKIGEIYSNILTYPPMVYPYYVDVIHVERVNGFRGFHFLITLEVVPTTGPHIVVGKDSITMDISPTNPDNVKVVGWKHLKDPQETNFPPNYKDILKK
ncbi:hypothetical protein PMSD_27710 [Paenibacillus macquariensis subsp. defensor]|nr:hypothetical protein PMSD_27710 [Paenibacillus macquariensis subsp. defensor]